MPDAPLQAVVFDCDGVLVDSEVLVQAFLIEVLAAHGARFEPADFAARYNGMTDDAFYAQVARDARELHGADLPPSFREDVSEPMRRAVRSRLAAVRGAAEAVRAAAARYPVAVASSSRAESVRFKLELLGVTQVFGPHVYSGEAAPRGKPAPDLFLHAAAGLGVPPEACLVVEDSRNGVLAGVAAGMSVWGFVGGAHCGPEAPEALRRAGAREILADWREFEARLAAV